MQKTYSSSHLIHQGTVENITDSFGSKGSKQKLLIGENYIDRPQVNGLTLTGVLSRVKEGAFPALLMLVITLIMDFLIYPIQAASRSEGMLVYFIFCLALGVYSLDRSTSATRSESSRAISGMAAGLFFWHALWLVQLFTTIDLASPAAIMVMVVVIMMGLTLWRPVLPLGVKFFVMSFLVSWIVRIFLIQIIQQTTTGQLSAGVFYAAGFLSFVGLLLCFGYLIYRAEFRIQRIWTAMLLWQSGLIAISLTLKMLF